MVNRLIHTPSYLATADIGKYWTTSQAYNVTSGWYVPSNSGVNAQLTKTFDSQSGWTVGRRFMYTQADTSYRTVLEFDDGTVTHVQLDFLGTAGLFRVTRNGTLLLTGTTALSINTEYYVEFQTVIADSGGVAILKVDGVTDSGINSSSLDTRNGGNASANIILISGYRSTQLTAQHKDIYINDNSGGADDTFWGPITVGTLTASGAGNKAQWTPSASTNVSNIDDTTPDDDSTYNATSTNGQIDSFAMTDTGYSAGTVKGVEWVGDLRKTDASGTAKVAPLYRISGTDYARTDITPTTTYVLANQRDRLSPATSAAWTVSELDAMEVGYKRTAA